MRRSWMMAVILTLTAGVAGRAGAEDWARFTRDLNQPQAPFKIGGNLYYVGTNDIAVFLLTSPQGHVLINSGFKESVPLIAASVEQLGFKLADVELLLASHAHFDHVAGHAALKRLTGAQVLALEADASVLEHGGPGGPGLPRFDRVKVDRRLKDGEPVTLGTMVLVPHLTPGHTPGNTTWRFDVEENGKRYAVTLAGSLTINEGVKLVGSPTYPGIAQDFAHAIEVLERLPVDVFLAPHASQFGLAEKLAATDKAGIARFVDPAGYKAFVARGAANYRAQLEREQAAAPR